MRFSPLRKQKLEEYKNRSILVILASLILSSCTLGPSKDITPTDIKILVQGYKSYTLDSSWLYTCPNLPPTLLTGQAWQDDQNFIYTNSYKGVSTLLLAIDGKLSTPYDTNPLRNQPIHSFLARERISSDLFTYDPLSLASSFPITLHFNKFNALSTLKSSKPSLSSNQLTREKTSEKPNLRVEFTGNGLLKQVIFTRPLGSPGCSEKITYIYREINSTSVKSIAQDLRP